MKTIGVPKQLRQYLNEVRVDKESVDATLNRLMDVSDVPVKGVDGRTNINLSEETYDRLNDYKLYATESIVSVVLRLVLNNKKEVLTMKVNDVEMTFDEFKKEFMDKLNIVFADDNFAVCTPTGAVVDIMSLSFDSDEDKESFYSFVEELGY